MTDQKPNFLQTSTNLHNYSNKLLYIDGYKRLKMQQMYENLKDKSSARQISDQASSSLSNFANVNEMSVKNQSSHRLPQEDSLS